MVRGLCMPDSAACRASAHDQGSRAGALLLPSARPAPVAGATLPARTLNRLCAARAGSALGALGPRGRDVLPETSSEEGGKQRLQGQPNNARSAETSMVHSPATGLASATSSTKKSRSAAPIGPAEPEIRLVTRMRQAPSDDEHFWGNFMWKARQAWDIFFPQQDSVLSPANAMKSRLHVLLVSDRCGLDMPTLMQIKNSSMAALAEDGGFDSLTELEVQVASLKANGERIQLNLPLSAIPERRVLRDVTEYDYEKFDDDDYFEHDDMEMPDEVDVRAG